MRRSVLLALLCSLAPCVVHAQVPVGPLTLAGYVQPDGLFSLSGDPFEREDTFRMRRARFTLAGKLNDLVEWETSAELTASPVLRDASVTFKAARWAHLRAGQFVTPYSLERLTSTARIELIDRVLDTFTPSRDMGFEVHSGEPIGGWLTYGAAIVNGTGQNQADNNGAKDVLGRLAFPLPRVRWVTVGVNGATGEQPLGRRDRYGADVHVRVGGFRFAGEFLRQDHEAAPDNNGFYLLAVHRWRAAELAGRMSRVRRGEERRRRVEAGANYYFSPKTRAMVSFVAEPDLPGTAVGIMTRMQFGF